MEYLGSISDSKSHVTKEYVDDAIDKKADKDGVYPDMTVGMTRDMLGVGEGDEGEFLFRPTDGDGSIKDGFASIERIEGNSVVWNQIAPETGWHTTGNATVTEQNGTYVVSFEDASSRFLAIINWNPSHKYIASAKITSDKEGTFFLESDIGWQQISKSVPANTPTIVEGFFNSGTSSGLNLFQIFTSGPFAMTVVIDQIKLIDLTQMFGAGYEPTTVEEFYQRIPKGIDINAYNEGEVVNMNVEGIKSVGFNAWDEEWENGTFNTSTGDNIDNNSIAILQIRSKNPIRVVPNSTYEVVLPHSGLWFMLYDSNGNIIDPSYLGDGYLDNAFNINVDYHPDTTSFVTPSNAAYIKFFAEGLYGSVYNHDICIHLVHTGYRNGEYEPYVSDEIALPIADYFPNGMNSIGDVKDELTATEAIQRIGVVDMGTLEWKNLDTSNSMFYLSAEEVAYLNMATTDNTNAPTNLVSSLHISAPTYDISNLDKVFRGPYKTEFSGYLTIKDLAYTDATSFKTAMSGVMLYYELAEPIVTSIDKPLALDYQVWDFGTEEAIAEGKTTPLKASIVYEFNARDTIRANKLALKNKADKTYVDNAIAQAIISTINANY